MNAKVALIALALALGAMVCVVSARGSIPVEAQDAELVALDDEADAALSLHAAETDGVQEAEESFDALDADMGVEDLSLAHNTDLSMPVLDADSAADEIAEAEALGDEDVAESESVSVAVAGDEEEADAESESVTVDADENASFLQVAEEDEAADEEEDEDAEEAEAEDEEEAEDEAEAEEEDVGAVQTALIEQIVEADVEAESDAAAVAMTDADVELVADAETAADVAAAADSGAAIVAEEDAEHTAADADAGAEMVVVEDFNVHALEAKETEAVATAGAVRAGLSDATIEAKGVVADASPVSSEEVIAVVSDHDARAAAGASPVFVETAAEADAQLFLPPTPEQQRTEQQHLDLMHSILVQLRQEQGRSVDEEMTPADMDAIEETMASLSLVEVTADTETAAATATATAAAAAAGGAAETTAAAGAAAAADAAHPRDHTVLVTHVVPDVEDPTKGAALSPATIIDPRRAARHLHPPKPKYRWDIQYHGERADELHRRKFLPNGAVEIVPEPHPVHARDPTKPSKLRKPVKPAVWDRRPFELRPKQQYRYDVTYEKRSSCCRRREACCIRGVQTKTIPARVKKPVRIIDPSKPEPQPPTQKPADKKKKTKATKKGKNAKKPKNTVKPHMHYTSFDDWVDAQRAMCCSDRKSCCAPPQQMYAADVQYAAGGDSADYVIVSPATGERGVVVEIDAEELSLLGRIQQRQSLLHKLLLTHQSPYYYDDHFDGIAMVPADAHHIVTFHEPAAASDPAQLTRAEQDELNAWMAQLPVVPHLAVVEVDAGVHAASGDAMSFLQTAEGEEATTTRRLVPARVLKGFVDVQSQPANLATLLSALPPMPAAAEEQTDEMADALAEAEADAENQDL